jgi:glycine/D-amino acid oxidase-like deaminating enzyme
MNQLRPRKRGRGSSASGKSPTLSWAIKASPTSAFCTDIAILDPNQYFKSHRTMALSEYDIIIIGGGCWGASTALALKSLRKDLEILLVKGSHPDTASRDETKIIRSTYPDEDFVEAAKEALSLWTEVDLYEQCCHKTGWIRVLTDNSPEDWKGEKDRPISSEDLQKLVRSKVKPQLDPGEKLWLNRDVCYVDSDTAVVAVLTAAAELGVEIIDANATELIVNNDACVGVKVGDATYTAKVKTIVAAGPWTPGLLKRSGVKFREEIFTVCGVPVATMSLTDEDFKELNHSMPILVTEGGESNLLKQGIPANTLLGEVIMSEKHQSLKITTTATFKFDNFSNPNEHEERLKSLDISPNRAVLAKMLPQFANRDPEGWICSYIIPVHYS